MIKNNLFVQAISKFLMGVILIGLFLAMPLVLASPFSFLIMLLYIPLIARRIKNEEKVPEAGYAENTRSAPCCFTTIRFSGPNSAIDRMRERQKRYLFLLKKTYQWSWFPYQDRVHCQSWQRQR